MLEFSIGDRTDVYFSVGGGLYAISLLLDQSFQEFDLTDNHVGFNVNAGLTRNIFTNWFLEASLHVHKFRTADHLDRQNPDWVYLYSEGDRNPLFWTITAGVALRMF
jgi:opacity protein-like surface antigen